MEHAPFSDAPEVVQQEPLDYRGREKLPAEAKKHEAAGGGASSRRYCGLRRTTFFIVLAVVALVIIGAVVGGAVGGVEASKSHDSSSSSSPTSSSASSATASTGQSTPTATGPIQPSQRAIAATAASRTGSPQLQVFYQDLDTTSVRYRLVQNDTAADEHTADLSVEPIRATPLAAAAVADSDPLSVQIFYLTVHQGATYVAQATLSCGRGALSSPCSTQSNAIIGQGAGPAVYGLTKLAALRPDQDTIRVYYQAAAGDLWALDGDHAKTSGWTANHIAVNATLGTGIVASGVNTTDMNVFFVSKQTDRLRWLPYDDVIGPQQSKFSLSLSLNSARSPDEMKLAILLIGRPNSSQL